MVLHQMSELHQRNKLIVYLFWSCLLLGIGAIIQYPDAILAIASASVPFGILCSILVWRRIATPYIMYIAAIGFNIISFFFIRSTDDIINSLILYLGLGIVSLYHNYRPLLLYGIVSWITLNYFLMTKSTYASVNGIGVNAFSFF